MMLSPPFVGACQPQHQQRPRVHLQFQELAAAQPDRPCVVTDTSEHSYGEVRTHSTETACTTTSGCPLTPPHYTPCCCCCSASGCSPATPCCCQTAAHAASHFTPSIAVR